jgi:surface protein
MFFINGLRVRVGNEFVNGVKLFDPYNPLDLPQNTLRVRTNDGNAPIKDSSTTYETATLVTGTTDIYDVYKSGTDFSYLLANSTNVTEVLGANTTGITNMAFMFKSCLSLTTFTLFDTSSVTDMRAMFFYCTSLTTVPLFDTSNVTTISSMFYGCTSLTYVPLFNTSSVTDMEQAFSNCTSLTSVPLFNTSNATSIGYVFDGCINVQSGALALYQQASTQANPPAHAGTFRNCGSNTQTGAAELAQIPYNWK